MSDLQSTMIDTINSSTEIKRLDPAEDGKCRKEGWFNRFIRNLH